MNKGEFPAIGEAQAGIQLYPAGVGIRRILAFIFFILVAFYLLNLIVPYGGEGLFKDPDIFWHMTVGEKIWRTGSLPHVDEFSHTFLGQPWIAKEWLGQLFFYAAYAGAGWRGVVLLAATVSALTYALLFLTLARNMRLTIAVGISTAAYIFSMDQFNLRPYIFAYPLIILWVAGLLRAVESGAAPSLLLLPVLALWANVHGSFTFGLAIAAALAAEAFLNSSADRRRETAQRWAIFLGAALCFACLTPYGYGSMLTTFQVFVGNDALNYIPEWMPLTLEALSVNNAIIFSLLFLAIFYGTKIPAWRSMIIISVTYMMFRHVRFIALFSIVVPILLLTPLTSQFPYLRLTDQIREQPLFFAGIARASSRFIYPLGFMIIIGAATFGAYGPQVSPRPNMTPAGAVDYIYKEHLTGNVYNFYAFGGYLIFRGIKTFVDGRSDQLFGNGFLTRLVRITRESPEDFIPYLDEYNVSIALVVPGHLDTQELERSSHWQMVYSDNVSVLFRKRDH